MDDRSSKGHTDRVRGSITPEPLLILRGVGEKLEIYRDRIVIRPTGFGRLLGLRTTTREIALRAIESVEYFGARTFLINGYLRFIRADGQPTIVFVYPRILFRRAERIRDTLDDMIGNRDVLPYLRGT